MQPVPPKIPHDTLFAMLRAEDIEGFNRARAAGRACELRGTNLRGVDLRGLDADGLDLRDCYLRDADLRGVDLRGARLEGASIRRARISGAFFPAELSAEEIRLSWEQGTRLRVR